MFAFENLCQEFRQMFRSASDARKVNEQDETELTWEDFTAELCKKHQANLVSSTSGCHNYEIHIPFEKDYELLLKEKKGKASVPLYFIFSKYNMEINLAEIKLCQKNISVISLFLKKFSKKKKSEWFYSQVQAIFKNRTFYVGIGWKTHAELELYHIQRLLYFEKRHEDFLQWVRKFVPEYSDYGYYLYDDIKKKKIDRLYILYCIKELINGIVSEILAQIAERMAFIKEQLKKR